MQAYRPNQNQTSSSVEKHQNESGFTLIEVLIAMAIMAIGLLAIAAMQVTSLRVNAQAIDITERTTVAQDKLEQLVALPYGNTQLDLTTGEPAKVEATPPVGFTVTWTVDAGPVSQSKLIRVTATKTTGGMSRASTTLTYVKSQL